MLTVDLTPLPDHDIQIGLLLAMLQDVTREWLSELGEVSITDITWQPRPNGHSIGAIFLHIIDVEAYWLEEIAAGIERSDEEMETLMSDEIDQYAVQWPKPPAEPLSWYLEQQAAVRQRTLDFVGKVNNPLHTGVRGDNQFTLRWLLQHVIAHEAYHGGQAVLLSLMRR